MIGKFVGNIKAIFIFGIFTVYFYILLFTLLPFIETLFVVNGAVYWFVVGYCLFIPIFISAVLLVRKEGNRGFNEILSALGVRKLSKRDWKYAIAGLGLAFLGTGVVFGGAAIFGMELETTPWFMEMSSFVGIEQLLLLVWLPMFFFNIVGEELLWRGYVQNRMRSKWLLCSLLWLGFHLPFGLDLMIMLIPVIIIIPYCFYKTQNTLVGIFIHGVFNGPVFIAIALGLLGK